MTTNATPDQIALALARINRPDPYNGNVAIRDIKRLSANRVQFTLKVLRSRDPGGSISYGGRRVPFACWHVHGNFFDALFQIDPKLWVRSGRAGKITKWGGNWQDWNAGSQFHPIMASEMCACGKKPAEADRLRHDLLHKFDRLHA